MFCLLVQPLTVVVETKIHWGFSKNDDKVPAFPDPMISLLFCQADALALSLAKVELTRPSSDEVLAGGTMNPPVSVFWLSRNRSRKQDKHLTSSK